MPRGVCAEYLHFTLFTLFTFQMMSLETAPFMFIRNLREANFEMFVTCIKAIVPWIFALNYIHYARWLPVYLQDQENLHDHAPSLYKLFSDGHFTVKQITRNFSNIAIDQAHKQSNKLVKIDGRAVGIFNSPRVLLSWLVASAEINSMLKDIDDDLLYCL